MSGPSDAGSSRTVIRPGAGWFPNVRELWAGRGLLSILVRREIQVKYRQTALGVVWVVLQPLLSSLIFVFVFGRIARLGSEGAPYLPFAFSGMLAYLLLSNTVSRASGSLVANASLVTKVYLPRTLLPAAVMGASLVDFLVGLLILVVINLATGVGFSFAVLLLPVWLLLLCALALGLSLAMSSIMVRYRDVQHIVPVALQMLLYLSPVAYGISNVPAHLHDLYGLNPLVGLLDGFRWSVIGLPLPSSARIAWAAGVSLSTLLIGLVVFARRERAFADVI